MSTFESIATKVRNGQRISPDEALALFGSNDLLAIGELAALANDRKNGKNVFFNVNRHINPTNICVNRCAFCAFSRTTGEEGAYTLALDEICRRAVEAEGEGATEVHIVGGLHPDLPLSMVLSWYEQKAVVILLTLFHLGIKNIKLGPTLPAFITPNVLNFLVENFNVGPITTVDADMKAMLG